MLRLAVTRDSGLDPWEIVGNNHLFDEVTINHRTGQLFDGAFTTTDEIFIAVEESESLNLTAASISGTGITDGTLVEQAPDNTEWIGFTDSTGSSGPSPFTADITQFVSGGTYTFTTSSASGGDSATRLQFSPVAALHPFAGLTVQPDGSALLEWNDILARLDRPVAGVSVTVQGDDMGTPIEIWEREDLPLGLNWVVLPSNLFMNGEFYSVTIDVIDVGGAIQGYTIAIGSWPTIPQAP